MVEKNQENNNYSIFKNWKAILAIIGVLILVFELIAMGLINTNIFAGKSNAAVRTGKTEFIGSIRTYEPYVFVPSQMLDADLFEKINALPGVMQVSQESGGILVKLETRDDVYPVALALKNMGFVSYSLANIATPSVVVVVLDESGQRINTSLAGLPIRAEVQPIIPLDSEIAVSMLVAVKENTVVQYGSAVVKIEEKNILINGTVKDKKTRYVFYVPWKERNSIDLSSLINVSASYNKSHIGVFNEELSIEKIISAKEFEYVSYIDKKSVIFSENFTDTDKAIFDFGTNITFLPSVLVVEEKGNGFSLPYNHSISYIYKISLQTEEYSFVERDHTIEIESYNLLDEDTITLSAVAKLIGNTIMELENVSIVQ